MSNDSCIFCKIIKGEIPATKVLENDDVLAFRDINPASPHHILVIPKIHKASLNDFEDADAEILGKLLIAARKIAAQEGFAENGYRVVNNIGDDGGQTVSHMHLHVLAGRRHQWPPG